MLTVRIEFVVPKAGIVPKLDLPHRPQRTESMVHKDSVRYLRAAA